MRESVNNQNISGLNRARGLARMQQRLFLMVALCGQRACTLWLLNQLALLDLVEPTFDRNGDPIEITTSSMCRDERCTRDNIHLAHDIVVRRRYRPNLARLVDASDDVLSDSVRRALTSTAWPKVFAEVYSDVRADYGTTTERTVHRHIAKLIADGVIVRLAFDDFAYDAYVDAKSRFLRDRENLRDHLLGKVSTTKVRRKVAA